MFHGGPGFKYLTLLSDIASFRIRNIVSQRRGCYSESQPELNVHHEQKAWGTGLPNGIPRVLNTKKA